MKCIFNISVVLLITVVVVDPGGLIPGAKEIFFFLTIVVGLLKMQYIPKHILFVSATIGLLLPTLGLVLGILADQAFSLEHSIGYYKSFLFVFLILVTYDKGVFIGDTFSKITLLLAILTLIIAAITGPYTGATDSIFPKENVVVSRRAFGPLLIDPAVFYKTSPLLLFGISYLCSKKMSVIKCILLLSCCVAMFVSGTRANIFSTIIIITYFLWDKVIKNNKVFRTLFFSIAIIIIVFAFPYVLGDVFFNKDEESLNIKLSLVDSYINLWNNYPMQLLFGSGTGSAMLNERGLSYLLEPTYFELIRYFGIIAFPVVLFILVLLPVYYFIKSYKTEQFNKVKYIAVAYLLYISLEISSNPLLISSTGMIVYVVALSSAYSCNKILDNGRYIDGRI